MNDRIRIPCVDDETGALRAVTRLLPEEVNALVDRMMEQGRCALQITLERDIIQAVSETLNGTEGEGCITGLYFKDTP